MNMNLLFWKKKEPQLTEEEKRHKDDAAKLAEFREFDNAVGSLPTEGTLRSRFQDAVFAGHTEVVKDTIGKGVKVPHELTTVWFGPFGSSEPAVFTDKPLQVAVSRDWPDMVEALLPHVDKDNLDAGLSTAEFNKNVPAAKAIKAELASRAADPHNCKAYATGQFSAKM